MSVRGIFLPDLLRDCAVGRNAAGSDQTLLAASPCSFECFQVFANVTNPGMKCRMSYRRSLNESKFFGKNEITSRCERQVPIS